MSRKPSQVNLAMHKILRLWTWKYIFSCHSLNILSTWKSCSMCPCSWPQGAYVLLFFCLYPLKPRGSWLGTVYCHRSPRSPRRPPPSCWPAAEVSTVSFSPPILNEAASICAASIFTSVIRGDTYVFFISCIIIFLVMFFWQKNRRTKGVRLHFHATDRQLRCCNALCAFRINRFIKTVMQTMLVYKFLIICLSVPLHILCSYVLMSNYLFLVRADWPRPYSCLVFFLLSLCHVLLLRKSTKTPGTYPSPLRGAPLQGSNYLLHSEWQTAYLSSWRNGRISKARIEILCCAQNDKTLVLLSASSLAVGRTQHGLTHAVRAVKGWTSQWPCKYRMTNRVPVIPTERSDEESPFQHIFPFSFLLSPFYFEFSPNVEMTMFQCATIGRIALNIVYNPFTKVHYTYAGGKSANGIREFLVIL